MTYHTDPDWSPTVWELFAKELDTLSALARDEGKAFERKTSDYLRTTPPAFNETGERTREEAALSKLEAQLARDCEAWEEARGLVYDVVVDFKLRMQRVLGKDAGGEICPQCGNRINPKSDKPKFWEGRIAMHQACHSARWRQENGRKKAS